MKTNEKQFTHLDLDLVCKIIERSPDIIFTINVDGIIQYVNESFCEILGYSKEESIGRNIREIAIEESIYNACMISVKETGKCLDQETHFRRKDGEIIHVIKNVNALYDEKGNISSIIINARDLTHIDNLNKELFEAKEKLESRLSIIEEVFLNINEAVAIIDKNGFYIEQNKAHEKLLGYSQEEIKGKTPLIHMKKSDFDKIIKEVLEKGSFTGEVSVKTKSGDIKDIELIVIPIRDRTGEIAYFIGIKKDITEKKERLYIDYLTGLPNRFKLTIDLDRIFNPKVILINIDSFKEINDVYGFNIGDKILISVASRIKEYTQNHNFQVYRIGGDEFAILIDRFIYSSNLDIFVNGLIAYIQSKPFDVEGYEINIDVTIGIAIPSEFNARNILEKADMALKYAKENRKPFFIYNENLELQKQYEENLKWVKILKNAINQNRIVLFYQPIFDNDTRKIGKFEALVRIKEGEKFISPFYFLDIAKKAKLYPHITSEVVKQAFKISRDYNVEISVNLSIKDILNETIVLEIFNQLKNNGANITFELLESEGIQNFDEVLEFIKQVKTYGAKIAIDDFGSGYSNFEYLLKLKVDYLKIDSSLIKNIHTDRESRIIVETITDFSKKLGIKTIAEFVHCEEVFKVVKEIGIDFSQGFYLGEPKPYITI
ncbi:MAG: EAL domain-containing protein [Hydrogenothermaceae bacterium]